MKRILRSVLFIVFTSVYFVAVVYILGCMIKYASFPSTDGPPTSISQSSLLMLMALLLAGISLVAAGLFYLLSRFL